MTTTRRSHPALKTCAASSSLLARGEKQGRRTVIVSSNSTPELERYTLRCLPFSFGRSVNDAFCISERASAGATGIALYRDRKQCFSSSAGSSCSARLVGLGLGRFCGGLGISRALGRLFSQFDFFCLFGFALALQDNARNSDSEAVAQVRTFAFAARLSRFSSENSLSDFSHCSRI